MNSVVAILMRRDGMLEEEAKSVVREVKALLNEAIDNGAIDVDDIMADELGLEPDYILDVLFFEEEYI